MPRVSGYLEITFKKEHRQIHQNIRIVANQRKHLHYFMQDKYKLGRKIDDFISTLYIGDGENILFRDSQKLNNVYLVKYDVKNNIEIDLKPRKFIIEGEIPPHDSCSHCSRAGLLEGSSKIRCRYYQKIVQAKIYCRDFFE